jgi:hypothetical protein
MSPVGKYMTRGTKDEKRGKIKDKSNSGKTKGKMKLKE